MAYPISFHRVVLGGSLYAESWNTSLSFASAAGMNAVSPALLAAIAANVGTWFTAASAGINFHSAVKLVELKVNRINTSGHYEDLESMTHVYPTPLSGAASGNVPPQLAVVATLRTGADRGLANRGRMYLPPTSGVLSVGSDGRMVSGDCLRIANAVAALINTIKDAYVAVEGTGTGSGHAHVMSDRGAGARRLIERVEVGRTVDTMRSRRTSLPEDYVAAATAVDIG